MIKVKMICEDNIEIERKINEWLEANRDVKVKDIELLTNNNYDRALIIYEVDDD